MGRFLLVVTCSATLTCGRSRIEFGACGPLDRYAARAESWDPDRIGGAHPQLEQFTDPESALGPPDYTGGSQGEGAVALGVGGFIVLGFDGCALTNDGTDAPDIEVFEVGPSVEVTWLSVRLTAETRSAFPQIDVDSEGFAVVGRVDGNRTAVDVDAILPGSAGEVLRFDGVRLVDDATQAGGADIDAVEILTYTPG